MTAANSSIGTKNHVGGRNQVQRAGLTVQDGWIELPKRPGLGIELDPDVIAAHPYAAREYSAAYYPDGSVADV